MKQYERKFKERIVRLHLEEGRTEALPKNMGYATAVYPIGLSNTAKNAK